MTRRYTILSGCSQYGDGVTQDEADAMAEAEKAAILRTFPDVEVIIECATGSPPPSNDEAISAWTQVVWDDILSHGGNGGYVEEVIACLNAIGQAHEEVST